MHTAGDEETVVIPDGGNQDVPPVSDQTEPELSCANGSPEEENGVAEEESPVRLRKKSPPPGLEADRRRYTALVDDKGLVHFSDGPKATQPSTLDYSLEAVAKNKTIQIDHLMHLLSSRLCSLEEMSSSIDKCMDSYELSARTKLEDSRLRLKQRVDDLIELYGREISAEVQKRRKTLQQLERTTEDHLASSNKMLTQAKLKLSRAKISNEDLRTLHDRILDSLVKTRKLQRDASEFDCWLDYIPSDPLQADHCIGDLQFTDPSFSLLQNQHYSQAPYLPASNSILNPYAEEYEPSRGSTEKTRNSLGATPYMSDHQHAVNGFGVAQSFQQDPPLWESKTSPLPNHPPGIPAPTNVAGSVMSFDDSTNGYSMNRIIEPAMFRRSTGNWNEVPFLNTTPNHQKSSAAVQLRRRMLVPQIPEYCTENPTLIYSPAQSRLDSKRHSLGANLSAYFSTRRSIPAVGAAASLLSLDMQRPVVIDCYGDQPPRHLKCIKGLTFIGANKLIICENGRKSGHKNVLMFSVTGAFLGYCGGPYSNPTGLCRISNDGLCVMDDGCIKVLSTDTFQVKQVLSLTDQIGEDDQNTSGETPGSNNVLSRQDRFGGLFCSEQMVYICDRKHPAIKVYDIRAGCRPVQTWNGNSAASSIGVSAARHSHPNLLPFSNPNFVHRKGDHVYVSDSGTNSVLILSTDGQLIGDLKSVTTSSPQGSSTAAKANIFNNPCGICDDGENLAVADLYNNRIQLFNRHCLIGSIYSPCIESPFSLGYNPMGVMAISNGRPRTVVLYFGSATV